MQGQDAHDGVIDICHLDKCHLRVAQVLERLDQALTRKKVDKCGFVALELLGDARHVEQRARCDCLLQTAAAVAMVRRVGKIDRILQLKAIHIASRHGHTCMLRIVDTQFATKEHQAVGMLERGRSLVKKKRTQTSRRRNDQLANIDRERCKSTYMFLAGKLDERSVLLTEHDFHAEDIAKAAKECEDPVGGLGGNRCRVEDAGAHGTAKVRISTRRDEQKSWERKDAGTSITARARSMLLQMSTGDGGMSLRMVRPVSRTGTPPESGRESRGRSRALS